MANSAMPTKVACLFILTLLVVAPQTQALTCGQMVQTLLPCLSYLKNGGSVPAACCNAARTLNKTAKTAPDRQLACACLKQAAKAFAINYTYGSQLADKCGLHLGIKVSPSSDCSKVH
uniref:Non-specific lipid-transfer protein n=1 Tax=Opuntia streptacantha TaxID=393608 RepID=A0A7C8YP85_OPUST